LGNSVFPGKYRIGAEPGTRVQSREDRLRAERGDKKASEIRAILTGPAEIEQETATIRVRYDEPRQRMLPVSVSSPVPAGLGEGGR